MNLKKTLSLILALIMIAATFGIIAIPTSAETVATVSATGTAETDWYEGGPDISGNFYISSANDLDGLAKLVNEGTEDFENYTIKLRADIVYNTGKFTVAADGSPLYNGQPVSETNAPRIWSVIGGTNNTFTNGTNKGTALPDNMFLGDFDGNGKAISGLYVNVDAINVGLFSVFGGESFKNTSILNSYFRGNGNIGSFAGRMKNSSTLTLEGLYSDAIIVGNTGGGDLLAGGITSLVETTSLTVNKCAFEGKFVNSSNKESKHIGGLIGETFFAGNETIENCFVNATFANVNADQQVRYWGGIIGITANASTNLSIKNVLVIVNIENINKLDISGAFVGSMYSGGALTVDNSSCYYITNHDEFKKGTNFKKTGTANGTEVTASTFDHSEPLGTEITKPSEAITLPSEVFVLTDASVAIKHLNACFNGHDFTELYQAKAASCDGEGWVAHYRCNNCSKLFDTNTNEAAIDAIIIPAAHNYGTLITGTPATCTENGTIDHYKCSLCNKLFDKDKNQVTELTILAGHTYGDLVPQIKPTCEEAGTIAHYKCSVCSKYFDRDKVEVSDIVIPVIDHKYGRWVEAVAPTPNAAGVLGHYKCSECRKYFDADKNELASIEGEPKLTTTKKPDTTNVPTTTVAEEKGCGGFAAVGSLLALIALTGAAVVIKKK